MLAKFHRTTLAASLTLILATVGSASAVTMNTATTKTSNADMGLASTSQKTNVTLVLKMRNQADLAAFIKETVTPGSAHFQKFLTTEEFAGKYGATDKQIAKVQAYLAKQGVASTVMANVDTKSIRSPIKD